MVPVIDSHVFGNQLLKWWKRNGRMFPWRTTRNPYNVLISEVLLHRTRASQVVPVYEEFLKKFPSIGSLSQANGKEVMALLRTLGLYWRARLLLDMTTEIATKHHGRVPSSKNELEALPGISDYIGSAVRCFAFDQPEILLDTNTVRIVGRVSGSKVTDSSRRTRKFRELYQRLLDNNPPRKFNYAMIDLGALICSPRNPECAICPVNDMCSYGATRIGRAK
jgi:A/G-specific adenine glycosylase